MVIKVSLKRQSSLKVATEKMLPATLRRLRCMRSPPPFRCLPSILLDFAVSLSLLLLAHLIVLLADSAAVSLIFAVSCSSTP